MANKKYSAAIYCGHGLSTDGSFDPGCVYDGMTEAALMLPITKSFVKHSRNSGIKVLTDVDPGENNNMNATKQIREANANDVDVFISLHCDWKEAPSGTMPLYCKGSAEGKKLAECLNMYVREMTGIGTRGVTARTDLGELNQTDMPACIYETGSIKADRKEWDTEKECDEYGKALAKGLCYYFGIPFKETKSATKKTTTTKTETKKETKKVTVPKKVESKVVTASIKKKGKSYKVAKHFTLGEFQCHNGADIVKYDE
ncbi:MAG: N-acetylmuramoyl-L-alanine amidase [Lachnospiraceae bacterium]|nr:N-acetylmuramoyl-L-alanine amidase [Lachnospiraceae bacterium]